MSQDKTTDYMIITFEITCCPYNKYGDSLRDLGGTMTFNTAVKVKTWAELAMKMAKIEEILKDTGQSGDSGILGRLRDA